MVCSAPHRAARSCCCIWRVQSPKSALHVRWPAGHSPGRYAGTQLWTALLPDARATALAAASAAHGTMGEAPGLLYQYPFFASFNCSESGGGNPPPAVATALAMVRLQRARPAPPPHQWGKRACRQGMPVSEFYANQLEAFFELLKHQVRLGSAAVLVLATCLPVFYSSRFKWTTATRAKTTTTQSFRQAMFA